MIARVLLFARLREVAGTASVAVDLPTGATAADVRAAVARALPAAAELAARCGVAVNQRLTADGDTVPDGAEVALIPPVSGG